MTHWLVKDFHVLYRAAEAATQEQLEGRGQAMGYLVAQLGRLKFAFHVCEAERSVAPSRLTEPERRALNALHRWLHSPSADCLLIEEAEDFHSQVEHECPEDCARLEEEERIAHAIARRELAERFRGEG